MLLPSLIVGFSVHRKHILTWEAKTYSPRRKNLTEVCKLGRLDDSDGDNSTSQGSWLMAGLGVFYCPIHGLGSVCDIDLLRFSQPGQSQLSP